MAQKLITNDGDMELKAVINLYGYTNLKTNCITLTDRNFKYEVLEHHQKLKQVFA